MNAGPAFGPPLTLTSSDRLARALREDHSLARRDEGLSVWESPPIRSLQQWMQDAWADSWPSAQLLNSTQVLALWLAAVERESFGVIGALGCAREAMEADRLASEYCLDIDSLPAYSDEHRAWRSWHRRVHRHMRERDWISANQLPVIVAQALRAGSIPCPTRIQLCGFGSPTPAERLLLDALGERAQLEAFQAQTNTDQRPQQAWLAADADAQFRLIADTVRHRLQACVETGERPPRIVIALPDADGRRDLLEDALSDRVAPWLREPGEAALAPWRWDRGRPLVAQGWTQSALSTLALKSFGNKPEVLTRFLLAPGLWNAQDRVGAAAIDSQLRSLGLPRLAFSRLLDAAEEPLRPRLQRLATLLAQAPRRALPSAWAAHFRARLDCLGWTEPAALPSTLYQTQREILREFARLAALDAQSGPVGAERAQAWLGELLKRRFEARAEHAQPVLIAGIEEALDLPCDLLIVADADSAAFPGPARSSAFLAIDAQRAAGIPQASPQAWLAHRRDILQRLMRAAGEVQLFATRIDVRGGEVLPSPLFEASWREAEAPAAPSLSERLAANAELCEIHSADTVPPVGEKESIAGNVALFRNFAETPFFAFCSHRLGIAPLAEYPRGLHGQLQGNLLHDALDRLWHRLGSSAALQARTGPELGALIEAALAPLIARDLRAEDFGAVLVELERERLHDILRQWLAFERSREPFTVVAREQALQGEIGGLPVRLRLDRADSIETGKGPRLIILDYKTGASVDVKGWDAENLREPQLPLYTVLLPEAGLKLLPQADGIAFAHVVDGGAKWKTYTAWEPPAGRTPPWHERLQGWHAALARAAEEFLDGRADLDSSRIVRGSFNEALLQLGGAAYDEMFDEPEDGFES